jgi:NAD(P)-dependent dehydrogenase (short-subunit alcohol dehydrogenase family)
MDLELRGKLAVVTGGSRGIGKAAASQLAREGADVALVARERSALESAAADIASDTGQRVAAFSADTATMASVRAMIAEVMSAFGRIDIVVNCAAQPGGQGKPPSLAEVTTEALWADVNVKVMGYLRTAREAAPYMKAQGSGRIINVSGLAARSTGTIIGSVRNVSVAALRKTSRTNSGLPASPLCAYIRPDTNREDGRRDREPVQDARRASEEVESAWAARTSPAR